MQNNLAWNTFFSAMRNWETVAPEKYNVSGTSKARYYDWSDGTTITERGSFSGSITRQPTQADRMAAEDRSRARVDRDMAPMREQVANASAGLMRAQYSARWQAGMPSLGASSSWPRASTARSRPRSRGASSQPPPA